MSEMVTVVGAGLAGCEAAWQLAQRGISVRLREMKPVQHTPAHHSDDFAELVCSNSLRSDELANAAGLLKEELRRLDSLILPVRMHIALRQAAHWRLTAKPLRQPSPRRSRTTRISRWSMVK